MKASNIINFIQKKIGIRTLICDLKGDLEGAPFVDSTETKSILTSLHDGRCAANYLNDLMSQRKRYLAKKGYNNLKEWETREDIEIPTMVFVINSSGPEKRSPEELSFLKEIGHLQQLGEPLGIAICVN